MTRQQAVLKAIELLSVREENKEMIEHFQKIFAELGKPTERVFYEKRSEETACASTWARRAKCKNWNDLLEKSGFEDCLRTIHAPHCSLELTTTEYDLSEAEYLKTEENFHNQNHAMDFISSVLR